MKTLLAACLGVVCLAGQSAIAQDTGSIQGRATDPSGAPVYGALVVVEGGSGVRRTTVTDGEGTFQISSLASGKYAVRISASGLSDWSASDVSSTVTAESKPLEAIMQVAPQVTTITVGLPPDEVATEQLNQELKQRALGGVFPNYYVSFESHPAPLSAKQKTRLASKLLLDPTTFAAAGITAGIQQSRNSYYQWGQGSAGFAKRYWAAYGTAAQNLVITSVVADSLLHQDPRYFYSGQGTKLRRVWYAIESAFRAKGDNGKWQPPYAGLVGLVASAELSQAYYPGERTQYSLLGRSLMFHFGGLVALNLAQEFVFSRLTSHKPVQAAASRTVLREGTPVPLIAVDAVLAEPAKDGRSVNFVLEEDLSVAGKVVVKSGEVASGQVGDISGAKDPGQAMSVTLEGVTLRAGNVNVPLRSNQVRGDAGPARYRELPGSGKVEVKLFVAQDVAIPDGQ
jgi:hypothetical protein